MKNFPTKPDPYDSLSPPKLILCFQASCCDSEKGSDSSELKVKFLSSGRVQYLIHGGKSDPVSTFSATS